MPGKNGATVEEPEGDDDDAQWAKASPRLKAIFHEALDEYAAKSKGGETTDDTEEDDEEDDAEGTADRGSGKRPAGGAAAVGRGRATKSAAPKRARQTRPSGGSFLDILIGH